LSLSARFHLPDRYLTAGHSCLKNPNIIFIMAEDMGYGDAGCYNPKSNFLSPNTDCQDLGETNGRRTLKS